MVVPIPVDRLIPSLFSFPLHFPLYSHFRLISASFPPIIFRISFLAISSLISCIIFMRCIVPSAPMPDILSPPSHPLPSDVICHAPIGIGTSSSGDQELGFRGKQGAFTGDCVFESPEISIRMSARGSICRSGGAENRNVCHDASTSFPGPPLFFWSALSSGRSAL